MGTAAPRAASGRVRSRHQTALLGYALLTGAFMWPAVVRFRTRPLLDAADGSFFYWAWWWMPHAIEKGNNPFETDMLFHPVGADLRLSTLAPLVSLVTAPVRVTLGPVAQVNAAQLLGAWLAAVGAYLLMSHVTGHRGAAFLGGTAYSFCAFRFMHAPGHLNLINTAFLPLGVLLMLRFLDAPSRARAAALGGVLAAAFLTDPQIAILTLACLLPVMVHERRRLRANLWGLTGAAVLALALAAPVLVLMVLAVRSDEGGAADDPLAMVGYSSDPTRWVVPPVDHPLLGDLAERFDVNPRPEGVAYPGLVIVALAAVGAFTRPVRDRWMWLGMFAIGFVLSLGPYLSYRGDFYRIPLPFMVLRNIPLLSSIRVPGRFALVGVLALDVLAVAALAHLARRRPVWLVGVGAVLLIELLPSHGRFAAVAAPPAYEVIRDAPGGGAVLEIPLQWSLGTRSIGDLAEPRDDAVFLTYATTHGHPLVNGVVSRYPDDRLEQLLAIPVYRQILALQGDPGYEEAPTFDRRDLAALGIGFVVYHRDRPMSAALRYVESLGLPVLADDGTVVVWGVG